MSRIRKLVAAGFTLCVSATISFAAIFLVAVLWLISNSATIQASEQKTAYPHMIECEVKGVRHYAYLDRVEADGRAYYISPSGKAAATVEGGVVTRRGAKTGNCSGKTLKELVASGQAAFIPN